MNSIPAGWPDRFSKKIKIGAHDECWEWLAVLIPSGYGQYWFEGRMVNAHRMALIFSGTDIPSDSVVMHACDNRKCCNPKHLSIGKQAENMMDMRTKRRSLHGERHNQAILTESAVRDIRTKHETAAEAAKRYGVSRATINDIRQGHTWKHIL